jgi:hypothetical protein
MNARFENSLLYRMILSRTSKTAAMAAAARTSKKKRKHLEETMEEEAKKEEEEAEMAADTPFDRIEVTRLTEPSVSFHTSRHFAIIIMKSIFYECDINDDEDGNFMIDEEYVTWLLRRQGRRGRLLMAVFVSWKNTSCNEYVILDELSYFRKPKHSPTTKTSEILVRFSPQMFLRILSNGCEEEEDRNKPSIYFNNFWTPLQHRLGSTFTSLRIALENDTFLLREWLEIAEQNSWSEAFRILLEQYLFDGDVEKIKMMTLFEKLQVSNGGRRKMIAMETKCKWGELKLSLQPINTAMMLIRSREKLLYLYVEFCKNQIFAN